MGTILRRVVPISLRQISAIQVDLPGVMKQVNPETYRKWMEHVSPGPWDTPLWIDRHYLSVQAGTVVVAIQATKRDMPTGHVVLGTSVFILHLDLFW